MTERNPSIGMYLGRGVEMEPSLERQAHIKASFAYADGQVVWLKNRQPLFNGKPATRPTSFGYLKVRLTTGGKREEYMAHRVVWFLCTGAWPQKHLDHENGVRTDNRIENLRECSMAENTRNRKPLRQGFKGVTKKPNGKHQAQINNQYLGVFDSPEDAARAYDAEAALRYGEFAYLNFPEARVLASNPNAGRKA